MSKVGALQKSLIIQSGVIVGVLIFLLVAYLLMDNLEGRYQKDQSKVKSTINQLNIKRQEIDKQLQKAEESVDLYESLQAERNNADKQLNRNSAKLVLDKLKQQYRLSSLSVKMEPVEELSAEQYQRDTTVTVHTQVTLRFGGLSDQHLFSFVDAVSRDLAGYVRIESLKMQRKKNIDNNVLLSVSKGDIPELVTGEMVFHWLGLREKAPKEKEGES